MQQYFVYDCDRLLRVFAGTLPECRQWTKSHEEINAVTQTLLERDCPVKVSESNPRNTPRQVHWVESIWRMFEHSHEGYAKRFSQIDLDRFYLTYRGRSAKFWIDNGTSRDKDGDLCNDMSVLVAAIATEIENLSNEPAIAQKPALKLKELARRF